MNYAKTIYRMLTALLVFVLGQSGLQAQSVGISANPGFTPDPSSILDISSESKGLLIPRVALESVEDISTIQNPTPPLLVYNTNESIAKGSGKGYYYYTFNENGPRWIKLAEVTSNFASWSITGNDDIIDGINFMGTIVDKDVVFKRFNTVALQIKAGGALLATGNGNTGVTPMSGPGQRMMWIPNLAAFRAGEVSSTQWDQGNVGLGSFAVGYNTMASNQMAAAFGTGTSATGVSSAAFGFSSVAGGNYSVAMGNSASAGGISSFAIGNIAIANGNYAFAVGDQANAKLESDIAMGYKAIAVAFHGVAIGDQANAGGPYGVAIGRNTYANDYSFAAGNRSKALVQYNIAIGDSAVANGDHAMALGNTVKATGVYSTALGTANEANGNYATALGFANIASGDFATTFGRVNLASAAQSTAIGFLTTASGVNSFSANLNTKAVGTNSSAFGNGTIANGVASIAIGNTTTTGVSAANSFAQGLGSQANGQNSSAFGNGTTANGAASIAIGNTTNTGVFAANSFAQGLGSQANGQNSSAFGNGTTANGAASIAIGNTTTTGVSAANSFAQGLGSQANGQNSAAFGNGTIANGSASMAIGNLSQTDATSTNGFAQGLNTRVAGTQAVSMGSGTLAAGNNSFAAGEETRAPYRSSFVIGRFNAPPNPNILIDPNNLGNADMIFQIGNGTGDGTRNNAFTVLRDGRVGINYPYPSASLDITAKTYLNDSWNRHIVLRDNGNLGAYASIMYDANGLKFKTNQEDDSYYLRNYNDQPLFQMQSTGLTFFHNPSNGAIIATIYPSGNMGISGTLTENSDIRLKRNIKPLSNILSKINSITPIYYEFKDNDSHPSGMQIGFSAQEIEKEFPQLVNRDSEGYLSVSYGHMTPVLLQAIKEQQQQIQQLTNKNEQLQEEIQQLKAQMQEVMKKVN